MNINFSMSPWHPRLKVTPNEWDCAEKNCVPALQCEACHSFPFAAHPSFPNAPPLWSQANQPKAFSNLHDHQNHPLHPVTQLITCISLRCDDMVQFMYLLDQLHQCQGALSPTSTKKQKNQSYALPTWQTTFQDITDYHLKTLQDISIFKKLLPIIMIFWWLCWSWV